MNKVVFLEYLGPFFDTPMILDEEFEDGRRTSRNEVDGYFYKPTSSLLRNNDRHHIPFK